MPAGVYSKLVEQTKLTAGDTVFLKFFLQEHLRAHACTVFSALCRCNANKVLGGLTTEQCPEGGVHVGFLS